MWGAIFDWLDAARWHFWVVGAGATAIWIWTILRNEGPGVRARSLAWVAWALASCGLVVAFRWPYFVGPGLLNPDEAQIIAGAITLKSYPVFWKYVDGTTHGPLADLPLLAANLFGVPLTYFGARLVAGIMVVLAFVAAGLGLAELYPARAVRLALSAIVFFWATVAYYDFTGYTSEQASIALLLVAVWPLLRGLCRTDDSPRLRATLLAVGGFLLGCVPYAKLQGVPPGVAMGVVALYAISRQSQLTPSTRWRMAACCAGGSLLPTALLGVYLWVYGLRGHFWASYILNNLLYASQPGLSATERIRLFWAFLDAAPGFRWVAIIFLGLAVSLLAGACGIDASVRQWPWLPAKRRVNWRTLKARLRWRGYSQRSRAVLGAFLVVTLGSLYASIGAHQLYGHYLQYTMVPVALGCVVFCGELWPRLARHPRRLSAAATLLLLLGILPLAWIRSHRADPELLGWRTAHHGEWRSPASRAIAALARPGDTMTVWGWMPYFHVETQLPQATREAHTYRQIEPGPMREYYRLRYLNDLRRSQPRLFVDAVGGHNFSYGEDRKACAHESFPALRELIDREYTLVETVDSTRIYVRR